MPVTVGCELEVHRLREAGEQRLGLEAHVLRQGVGGAGGGPIKVHWGYPDPSNAEGGDEGKRRAFDLTRQAIGYRMLQLLALPLEALDRAALHAALIEIGRS